MCCRVRGLPPDLQTYGIDVALMLPVHVLLSPLTEAAQILVGQHLQETPPAAVVLWLAVQMVPADSQGENLYP